MREAAVAHCPLSNVYFANAVFPLLAALEKGLHVGLGTDISGGPSASMLENCRGAILMSRALQAGVDPNLDARARATFGPAQIDFRDAFYIATTGGGVALDLPVGQFKPGYLFDAIVIDTKAQKGSVRLFDEFDTGEQVLEDSSTPPPNRISRQLGLVGSTFVCPKLRVVPEHFDDRRKIAAAISLLFEQRE